MRPDGRPWLAVVVVALALLGSAAVTPGAPAAPALQPAPSGTSHPLYLPLVRRRQAEPPPPLTPIPMIGYVCRSADSDICWPSADYTLATGPGEACNIDMSVAYYLVAAAPEINLETREGQYVQVWGATDEAQSCAPLVRVVELRVLP